MLASKAGRDRLGGKFQLPSMGKVGSIGLFLLQREERLGRRGRRASDDGEGMLLLSGA